MGNRSHLRPSTTVDKNGRVTTVYVSPENDVASFSMLSSTPPSLPSYDDDDPSNDEWDDSGLDNPESWKDNDFGANDAINWDGAGFNADEAYDWRSAGFNSDDASEWEASGFTPSEAENWKSFGDAGDSQEWSKEGFDPETAQAWSSTGFMAETAKDWRNEGFEAGPAMDWSNQSFEPSEAIAWSDAGFKDPDEAADWNSETKRLRDVDMSKLLFLKEAGELSSDAPMWMSLLDTVHGLGHKEVTLSELHEVMNGMTPSAGDEYASYFPYSRWETLSSNGIGWDSARHVIRVQAALASRDEETDGDEYEEDEEGNFEDAVLWLSKSEDTTLTKANIICDLINAGETITSSMPFLRSDGKKYDGSKACFERIRAAQRWASEADKDDQVAAYERLYKVLADDVKLDVLSRMVEEHGFAAVDSGLSQGLESTAQLQNYLEGARVASISAGAL